MDASTPSFPRVIRMHSGSTRAVHPPSTRWVLAALLTAVALCAAQVTASSLAYDAQLAPIVSGLARWTAFAPAPTPLAGPASWTHTVYLSEFGGTAALRAAAAAPSTTGVYGAVVGVAPICVAYNATTEGSKKLLASLSDLASILQAAGNVSVRALNGSGAVLPHRNWAEYRLLLPSGATGTARAWYTAMAAAGVSLFSGVTDTPAPIAANANVTVHADDAAVVDAAVAAGAGASPAFFLAVTSAARAGAAGLSCLRIIAPSGTTYPPAMDRTKLALYSLSQAPALSAKVLSATAAAYPLVGPVVVYINITQQCAAASASDREVLARAALNTWADPHTANVFVANNALLLGQTPVHLLLANSISLLCLTSTRTTYLAGGSTTIAPILASWFAQHRLAVPPATTELRQYMSYTSAGTGYALSALETRSLAFGGAESTLYLNPMSTSLQAANPALVVFPILGYAIALVFNLPVPCPTLRLPRCALPLIFNGNISRWDDDRLQNANPTLNLPGIRIQLVARSDLSGNNLVVQSVLAGIQVECGMPVTFVESESWTETGGSPVKFSGVGGVSSYVLSNPYSLGYLSYPSAVSAGNSIAYVFDPVTQTSTFPDETAVALALNQATIKADHMLNSKLSVSTYPFLPLGMILLDLASPNCTTVKHLTDFLIWVYSSDDADSAATALSFVPLPQPMQQYMIEFIRAKVTCGGALLYPPPVAANVAAVIGPAVAIPGVVALATIAVYIACFTGRNNRAAPKDPSKPVALAFTDIQASTTLWSTVPEAMGEALSRHNDVVRRVLARHRGYEVKTIGDAFMIAFSSVADAVNFALDAQMALYSERWAPEIDEVYDEMAAEKGHQSGMPDLWRGLRVRIGIHYGLCDIHQDANTQGYDYHGNVVNMSARVEDAGHGGQVVVTKDVCDALPAGWLADTDRVFVKFLGDTPLRGIPTPTPLYQLSHPRLAARQFPALRTDGESHALVEDESESESATATSSHAEKDAAMLQTKFALGDVMDTLTSPMPPAEALDVLRPIVKAWRIHIHERAKHDVGQHLRSIAFRLGEILSVKQKGNLRRRSTMNSMPSGRATKYDVESIISSQGS